MRHIKVLALMMIPILALTSCGKKITPEDKARQIKDEYSNWDKMTVTADITADYGENVYDFKLRYDGSGDEGTVEILEPESLSGVSAVIDKEGNALRYDGIELALGDVTPSGCSPMECIPMMMGEWSKGYVKEAVWETVYGKNAVAVTFALSEDEFIVTWFEEETNLPIRAEMYFDGSMVVSCEFENIVT